MTLVSGDTEKKIPSLCQEYDRPISEDDPVHVIASGETHAVCEDNTGEQEARPIMGAQSEESMAEDTGMRHRLLVRIRPPTIGPIREYIPGPEKYR